MTFPNVLKKTYAMKSSDLNVVGEHLGYKWNDICKEISDEDFYAQDGDGSMIVEKDYEENYTESKKLNHILVEIFKNNPGVEEITIVN